MPLAVLGPSMAAEGGESRTVVTVTRLPTTSPTCVPTMTPSSHVPSFVPSVSPTRLPSLAPSMSDQRILDLVSAVSNQDGVLEDPTSPQSRARDWLLTNANRAIYPNHRLLQRYAMALPFTTPPTVIVRGSTTRDGCRTTTNAPRGTKSHWHRPPFATVGLFGRDPPARNGTLVQTAHRLAAGKPLAGSHPIRIGCQTDGFATLECVWK